MNEHAQRPRWNAVVAGGADVALLILRRSNLRAVELEIAPRDAVFGLGQAVARYWVAITDDGIATAAFNWIPRVNQQQSAEQ